MSPCMMYESWRYPIPNVTSNTYGIVVFRRTAGHRETGSRSGASSCVPVGFVPGMTSPSRCDKIEKRDTEDWAIPQSGQPHKTGRYWDGEGDSKCKILAQIPNGIKRETKKKKRKDLHVAIETLHQIQWYEVLLMPPKSDG
jgi:hypothetical protein